MIYLDGDIQVFENIDHLFDMPNGYFYAVMDCFCEKTWSHSPQYKIGYCQQCPNKVQWPANSDLGPKPPLYFNAGMFVYEPNLSTYDDLLATVKITTPTSFAEQVNSALLFYFTQIFIICVRERTRIRMIFCPFVLWISKFTTQYLFFVQDFLNMFFRDIYKPIPPIYNLVLAMLWRHPENIDLKQVKVVHYCAAGSKPWRYTGKEENMDRKDIKMLVKMWWDIYNDDSLNYIPPMTNLSSFEGEADVVGKLMASLSEGKSVKFMSAPSAA